MGVLLSEVLYILDSLPVLKGTYVAKYSFPPKNSGRFYQKFVVKVKRKDNE